MMDGEEKSWWKLYAMCQAQNRGHEYPHDTLRNWDDKQQPGEGPEEEEEDVVNLDVAEMMEADWQLYGQLHPAAGVPIFEVSDLGIRPIDEAWNVNDAQTCWNDID